MYNAIHSTRRIPLGTHGILFPFIFLTRQGQTFCFLYEVRYFFYTFCLCRYLEVCAGRHFHVHEMSGILLYQHQQLLTNSPDYWHTRFILYLIQHRFCLTRFIYLPLYWSCYSLLASSPKNTTGCCSYYLSFSYC